MKLMGRELWAEIFLTFYSVFWLWLRAYKEKISEAIPIDKNMGLNADIRLFNEIMWVSEPSNVLLQQDK